MIKIIKQFSDFPMLKFNPNFLFRRFFHTYLQPSTTSQLTNYINLRLDSFLSHHSLPLKFLLPFHSIIIVSGNYNNVFIASKLISRYASLSKPDLSSKVFDSVRCKDPFLWNSIIKSHFSCGNYEKALGFFLGMRFSDTPLNNFTIPMVVSVCAELFALDYGVMIHGLVVKYGVFGGNSAVGSSFVYFYSKCGYMKDAYKVFDEMPVRDVVAWTALIVGYLQNGESHKGLECLCMMHNVVEDCVKPNYRTLGGGFQACGNIGALTEGKCLHALAIKIGYGLCHDVQSSLLSMYSKWGTIGESCHLFYEIKDKDLICWTSIIAAYSRLECVTECLGFFWQMLGSGIYPDEIVISCVLSSLGDSSWVSEGMAFHGLIMKRNYVRGQVVHRALISMYCRFGMFDSAEQIFDTLRQKNPETWNLMVFEYGKGGLWKNCVNLFQEMIHQRFECDSNSLISVISSCLQLGTIHLGKSIHCYVIKSLLDDDVSVSNSLIDMYGKCGKLTIAKTIFGRMQRDIVTWNTLIYACAFKGELAQALALFDQMMFEGSNPSTATLVTVLSACSRLASLEKGMKIHNYIREMGVELNISLATALVDMYGKCGQLGKARDLFNSMNDKDAIAWNVMISCYGIYGDARSAIEVFKQMEKSSVRPNELTFLGVLLACSHAGFTEEGRYYFRKMHDYFVIPTLKHYACIVDLLGKSGNLKEAEDIVMSMPITPDGGLWGTLLSACKIHNEVEIGLRIVKHAIKADPENDGYYITMSNLLDSNGKWEEAEMYRQLMKNKGVSKRLGWSSS
uniref:Pentatricopeptide repeat-containing protein n=2 Tax=Chenopodium quinoa TaxID=63459 RepID=A0A803MES8_CHEQI